VKTDRKTVGFSYRTTGIATSPLTTTANRAGSYIYLIECIHCHRSILYQRILNRELMNKTLGVTFVTIAVAALVTGMTTIGTPQSANAACDSSGNTPYGRGCVSQESNPNLNGGTKGQSGFGGLVSDLAKSSGGLQDFRASGCGANQYPAAQGGNDVC
jgi:hypothetical protein